MASSPYMRPPGSQGWRGADGVSLPDFVDAAANVAVFQITGALPLSLEFVFIGSSAAPQITTEGFWSRVLKLTGRQVSGSAEKPEFEALAPGGLQARVSALSGAALTHLLQEAEDGFDQRFAATFNVSADSPNATTSPSLMETSKAALSNLLGGIGYFYGRPLVELGSKAVEGEPSALLTSVPSRSFFPRGFLWDEGFHQLLVQKWNPQLSREILASWLDQLNSQGWIAREQILGEEARSRVPSEFIVQDPTAANPPTLFLPLADMARRLAGSARGKSTDPKEEIFLRSAFPRMRVWLDWFVRTQQGKLEGSWRWRGRSMDYLDDPLTGQKTDFIRQLNPKTLTSGLDDYPRASHPSDDERHVDLFCWMALAAKSLQNIGEALALPPAQVAPYRRLAEQLTNVAHLKSLHYDTEAQQFRDWGNHTEDVRLAWRYIEIPPELQGMEQLRGMNKLRHDMVRQTDRAPKLQFVPHFGFVSLFPLCMRLLPAHSRELAQLLQQLRSEDVLTPFGLQSLSSRSSLYGKRNTEHDPPYWRGPVWININFLVLASLHHYAQAGGETGASALELHDTLRERLLGVIVSNYASTGFLWENYDEKHGSGRGCRPFTGWTALLVLIAGGDYFVI